MVYIINPNKSEPILACSHIMYDVEKPLYLPLVHMYLVCELRQLEVETRIKRWFPRLLVDGYGIDMVLVARKIFERVYLRRPPSSFVILNFDAVNSGRGLARRI